MAQFERFEGSEQYIADDALLASVNAAIALQRPLLVRGEPGTGKTMLARSIAETLNKSLLSWHVKSSTAAQEGLYTYDVRRSVCMEEVQLPSPSFCFVAIFCCFLL